MSILWVTMTVFDWQVVNVHYTYMYAQLFVGVAIAVSAVAAAAAVSLSIFLLLFLYCVVNSSFPRVILNTTYSSFPCRFLNDTCAQSDVFCMCVFVFCIFYT